ncbi:MAG TPA: hypothetical protein VIJ75_16735 [Hanamia sp.]
MNYVVTKQMKSRGIAALLVFLFWPIGMFYSTLSGALIMSFIIGPIVLLVTLSSPFGIIVCPLFFIFCLIWAIRAVNSYNRKILKEATSYNKNAYGMPIKDNFSNEPIRNTTEQEIKDSYQDLERINSLRFSKVITDDQYIQQKENILNKIEKLRHTNVLPDANSSYEHTTSYNRNSKPKLWLWILILFLIFSLLYVLYDSKTNSLKLDKITYLFSSQFPTESMALKKIESEQFDDKTNNFIEIVAFKKTDGVKTNIFGVEGYLFSYSLKVKLKQNMHTWDLNNLKDFETNEEFYKALKEGPELNKYDDKDFYEEHKKGEIINYTGSINFEKTENGWH